MSNIGEYLKSLREEKKLDFEEISQQTKIKIHFLKDIENNLFEDFGGIGYAKATIFSYGKYLKANEKKMLHLFNKFFDTQTVHSSQNKYVEPKKVLFPANIFAILLLVVFVVVLSIISYKLYSSGQLKFPFRGESNAKNLKNSPKEKILEKKSVINSKPKEIKSAEVSNKEIIISKEALQDTTDYINTFMFKNKKNPFNQKE
ncbi:MAG: helix-turn-helix domain-containing protein [Candidatus Cloacimonetes bacterium]|nr:helix-turn-helix domain-containing protein [Candidatus Cloacimonadota bacterium]